MKKGDKVVWRPAPGREFVGKVTAMRKVKGKWSCYVLFDGGGHWLDEDELEKTE